MRGYSHDNRLEKNDAQDSGLSIWGNSFKLHVIHTASAQLVPQDRDIPWSDDDLFVIEFDFYWLCHVVAVSPLGVVSALGSHCWKYTRCWSQPAENYVKDLDARMDDASGGGPNRKHTAKV